MKALMRTVRIFLFAAAAVLISSAVAQTSGQSGQELPSAPSASAPKKSAPPAAAQTAPASAPKTDAAATQPVLQSLSDGKRKPAPQSAPAQDPQKDKGNQDPTSAIPPADADKPAGDKVLGA